MGPLPSDVGSGFGDALSALKQKYQNTVDDAILEACERQNLLSERMKHVEDLAKRTAAETPRQDTTAAEALLSLEGTLRSVMSTLDDTVASIKLLDDALPLPDRLVAPGNPHHSHYPILHDLVAKRGPCTLPAASPRQSVTREDASVCKEDKDKPPRAADTLRNVMLANSTNH